MNEEFSTNSRVIHGPWIQQPDSSRLSMSQFRSSVSYYSQSIANFEGTLQEILRVLTINSGHIQRPYSRKVQRLLFPLHDHIHEFCFFLEDTSRLPLVLSALHYGFLPALHFLDEQIRLFLVLLDELCSACILRPHEVLGLFQRAHQTLTIIIERVQQLPIRCAHLVDQASFYDKALFMETEVRTHP